MNSAIAKQKMPPGPTGHPLLGNILDFGRDLNGFLSGCARKYGPVTRLRMVHRRAYLLSDAKLNEYLLLGNYKNFIKHQLFFRRTRAVFGLGLLSADGDFWRKQRRLAAPGFARDRIAGYGRIMSAYARDLVAEWKDGETRDMYTDMRSVAAKIVARSLFDESVEGDVQLVEEAMTDLLEAVTVRMLNPFVAPDWLPTPSVLRYRRAVKRIDDLIHRFIAEHRRNLDQRTTLLGMLMQARDEQGEPMSEQQLRDESVTLFIAGHDTTATALSWTLYLLTQHPEWQQQLQAVVDEKLQGRAPQVSDMAALAPIEWTFKESLRLYPSVSLVARQSLEDCEIGGYHIPGGSLLYVSPAAMHSDPQYFEQPERFMPERWGGDLEARLPRCVYMPFSGGPRTCIGDRFAMMEGVLLLANFLQFFAFEYAGKSHPQPFASITLIPKGGVPVKLTRRDVGHPVSGSPIMEAAPMVAVSTS
ncbi:cytochrome P450 [Hydrocarboniphaga sp.]|uniref:cytochrome P450 n=1 Tax=Hydrocarboniphaga sp. TaxID=2033016 RepID=UPI003D0DDA15